MALSHNLESGPLIDGWTNNCRGGGGTYIVDSALGKPASRSEKVLHNTGSRQAERQRAFTAM